jgi:CMP/dCMP kinase
MAVITISRQYGSGGDEIADRVCSTLSYKQFDKRQIMRAAAEAGFSEEEISHYADFSEQNYKIKRFLNLLLHKSRPCDPKQAGLEEKESKGTAEKPVFSESTALNLVQKAIHTVYWNGDTVIVGRGSQVMLKGKKGVIHVRIEADLEDRVQRVMHRMHESPPDREEEISLRRFALEHIDERDTASADYVYQFYRVDWADRSLYHAVLNTSKLSIDQAAQIIVDLVQCLAA